MDYRKYIYLWSKKLEDITLDDLKLLKEMYYAGFVPMPDRYSATLSMKEWVSMLEAEWESRLR